MKMEEINKNINTSSSNVSLTKDCGNENKKDESGDIEGNKFRLYVEINQCSNSILANSKNDTCNIFENQ